MARKSMPVSGLPEGFALTEKTVAWVNEKYPTVEIGATLERFTESALTHGRMYADWQAAFRTWVRRAIENKWDGVEFKKGRIADPKWTALLEEARRHGFREPHQLEGIGAYRTDFERWRSLPERHRKAPVIEFGNALRGFGK